MSLFRSEVKRKQQRRLKQAFRKKQSVQQTKVAVIAGHNLLSINGQMHRSSIVAGQVGDAVIVVNDGTASNAVYVPAAAGAGASSFTSGSSSTVTTGGGTTIDETAFLRRDGSLSLIGNLAVAGNVTIDGVDLGSVGDGLVINTSKQYKVDVTQLLGDGIKNDGSNNFAVDAPALVGVGLTHDGLNNLRVGTPSSVSASSVNLASGTTHNHTVVASSNPGAVASLLKSTAAGALTLESFQSNGEIVALQSLYAGSSNFRVLHHTHDYDHVHVIVNPTGAWSFDEQFGVDIDDNLLVRGYIVGKHAIQLSGATLIVHFDGPEPYETNFKGVLTGHMGQVPTVSGGVIFRGGKFGKAVQVSQATTNLCTNPSFETNLTGWTAFNSGSGDMGATRVQDYFHTGEYAVKLSSTTIGSSQFYHQFDGGFVSGTSYTFSVWMRAEQSTSVNLRIRKHASPQTVYAGTTVTATRDWKRFSVTYTSAASTETGRISIEPLTAGVDIWVDAVQMEALIHATPYCDGSLDVPLDTGATGGHTWSGTAHASTSSRTSTRIRYSTFDVLDPHAGTIMLWCWPETVGEATNNRFVIAHSSGDNTISLYITASGNWSANIAGEPGDTTPATVRTWQHVCVTWDEGAAALYVNGAEVGTWTYTGTPVLDSLFDVGQYSNGFQQWNGLVEDLVILNRAITADELRAVYDSDAPVFAETATFHWRAGANRVWADTEGLWALTASGGKAFAVYSGDEEDPSATKSWGGLSLSEGDILIGDSSRGGYLHWDDSLDSLKFAGAIDSATGYSNISDRPADSVIYNSYVNQHLPLFMDFDVSVVDNNTIDIAAGGRVDFNNGGSKTYNAATINIVGTSGVKYVWVHDASQADVDIHDTALPSTIPSTGVVIGIMAASTVTATWMPATSSLVHIGDGQIVAGSISATHINGVQLDVLAANTGTLVVDEKLTAGGGDVVISPSGLDLDTDDLGSTPPFDYDDASNTTKLIWWDDVTTKTTKIAEIINYKHGYNGGAVSSRFIAYTAGTAEATAVLHAKGTSQEALAYTVASASSSSFVTLVDKTQLAGDVYMTTGPVGIGTQADASYFLKIETDGGSQTGLRLNMPSGSTADALQLLNNGTETLAVAAGGAVEITTGNATPLTITRTGATAPGSVRVARATNIYGSGLTGALFASSDHMIIGAADGGSNYAYQFRSDGAARFPAQLQLPEMSTPSTVSGIASIYVDTADGDLKVKFGNGTVKTIATN